MSQHAEKEIQETRGRDSLLTLLAPLSPDPTKTDLCSPPLKASEFSDGFSQFDLRFFCWQLRKLSTSGAKHSKCLKKKFSPGPQGASSRFCLSRSAHSLPAFPGRAPNSQGLLRPSAPTGWTRAGLSSPRTHPGKTGREENHRLPIADWTLISSVGPNPPSSDPSCHSWLPLLLWEALQACSPLGPVQPCSFSALPGQFLPLTELLKSILCSWSAPPPPTSSFLSVSFPSALFGICPLATASYLTLSFSSLCSGSRRPVSAFFVAFSHRYR